MRVPLLRGPELDGPKICDHCGRRVVMGIMFSVKIGDVKYRACSLECEKALRARPAECEFVDGVCATCGKVEF